MAAPSGKFYGVGLKHARVYLLDTNGVPDAPSTSAYIGLQTVGAKAYELNIPDARRIAHTGDDRVLAQDVLPRMEVSNGTLRVARQDFAVFAVLTSTKEATIGESKIVGYGTNKQGAEPGLCALLYQQNKDAVSGNRKYNGYILPSTQALINPASFNENAPEHQYSLLPSGAVHYPWGTAFTEATEGFIMAEMLEFETDGLPMITAWKADGIVTQFSFHADFQASATAKIHKVCTIATNGTVTDVTATATLATDKVTITGPLAAGVKVVAWYEIAA